MGAPNWVYVVAVLQNDPADGANRCGVNDANTGDYVEKQKALFIL